MKISSSKKPFSDSDFAGVAPPKRKALVAALNTLSDQVRQADQALHSASATQRTAGLSEAVDDIEPTGAPN